MSRRGAWKPVSEGVLLRQSSGRAPGPRPAALLPDIPELREREKKEDRKGGAAPWYLGSGPGVGGLYGGPSVGVGSSLALRSGLLGRMASALAGALGGPGTLLGRFFASSAGRWALGAALAVWAGLLLAVALRTLGGDRAGAPPESPAFSEAPLSTVRVSKGTDRSLDFLVAANKGELPESAAPAPQKPVDAQQAPATPEPGPDSPLAFEEPAPTVQPKAVLRPMGWGRTREGFGMGGGALQASALGSLGALGSRGGANFPSLGSKAGGALERSKPGRLASFRRARQALATRRIGGLRGRSTRAMGQLKLANALSMLGAASDSDQVARSLAGDAFDQAKSAGGELAGVIGGTGVVVPLGGGAPEVGVTPGAPEVPPGVNVTPYQGQVDNARGLGEQAAALKNQGMMMLMMGAMLLMLGIALIAAGAALMAAPPPMNLIGVALMAAGAALAAAGGGMISQGMDMLEQAQRMAQQAKNQGNDIAQRYGQPEQGGIVGQCAQQAADTGVPVDGCAAQNPAGNQQAHGNVRQAVEEEANAGFTLRPAGGPGAAPGK